MKKQILEHHSFLYIGNVCNYLLVNDKPQAMAGYTSGTQACVFLHTRSMYLSYVHFHLNYNNHKHNQ